MAKCSRCGNEMGEADVCPACGAGPSRSVGDRGTKKASPSAGTASSAASATGEAIELGVRTTETVAREAKPFIKSAVSLGRKGASKAKKETLGVAKKLKEEE